MTPYATTKSESPLGPLPNDWKVVRLKEVTKKIGSGATPRGGQTVYLSRRNLYAFIRSQNVLDRHFGFDGLAFISDHHAGELKNVLVQSGDILLNITGDGVTFGRACIAPDSVLPACVNQHVSIIRLDRSLCDPGYLVSCLTHPLMKIYIESFNAGGSRRAITKGHIESFEIPIPPLSEQLAIARILGALDEKIELNRRMNRTLEAMAQALFEEWAKKNEGQASTYETQDLIDRKALVIGDGYRAKRIELSHEGLPFARAGNLTDGFDFQGAEFLGAEGIRAAREKVSQDYDAVFTSKGSVGRLAQVLPNTPRFVYAPQLCYWRVLDRSVINPHVLFQWMKGTEFIEQLDALKGQTDMADYVSLGDQRRMEMSLPLAADQSVIGNRLDSLAGRLDSNSAENRSLASLRDFLLPRLLLGEIRVGQAEKVIEAAL